MNEKPIKDALEYWLNDTLGERHVFTITFNADFVTGNLISATFTGDAAPEVMDQVTFTTSQAATLELLRKAIQRLDCVFTARVTGARQITCRGNQNGVTIAVTGPTVTLGASQAVATVATVSDPIRAQVIDEDQNSAFDDADVERPAPRPPYPYATIKIDSLLNWSWDENRSLDADGIMTMGGQRRATVSVNFFGKNHMDEISKAANGLEKENVRAAFKAAGFAVWGKNSMQNLTAMLETKNEPRAFFDFFIGLAENYEDDVGIIERVQDLEGEVDEVIVGPINVDIDP